MEQYGNPEDLMAAILPLQELIGLPLDTISLIIGISSSLSSGI
jgi:hypothetical protein